MLSEQEKDFLQYWEVNRHEKKKFLRQFSIGLPIGVGIIVLFFINILSGWYKKADMVIRSNSSVIIVIIIAAVAITIFMTIFWSKHKWDQNEQRYLELKQKVKKDEAGGATVSN